MTTDTYSVARPTGTSLLTTSPSEASGAAVYGYTVNDGIAFRSATTASPGLVAVTRMYRAATADFIWVTTAGEASSAASAGYVSQGVNFYAATSLLYEAGSGTSCTVGVYRLVKGALHRYAVDAARVDALLAQGWTSEGIRFYARRPSAVPAFSHPGIGIGAGRLDLLRANISAGVQPYAANYANTVSRVTTNGLPVYTATPAAVVGCNASTATDTAHPCYWERKDSERAYQYALLANLDPDRSARARYAAKAIEIINAWSSTLTAHQDPGGTFSLGQTRLNSSWAAMNWTRAGELVRYPTYPGDPSLWTAAQVSAFNTMLTNAYRPWVEPAHSGGGANLLMSMADAYVSIAVFQNDRARFNAALDRWRAQLRSVLYLSSDGAQPLPFVGQAQTDIGYMRSYWYSNYFVNGQEGEICRDVSHASMSFAALANTAETARLQGVDLYGENDVRIRTAVEYNAGQAADRFPAAPATPAPAPAGLCRGQAEQTTAGYSLPVLATGGESFKLTWRQLYLHYSTRANVPMPQLLRLLQQPAMDSQWYRSDMYMVEERLTASAPLP